MPSSDADVVKVKVTPGMVASYMRAGCPMPLAEWAALPDDIRGAMNLTADNMRRELALMIALACSGEEGYATVAEPIDDGAMLRRVLLKQAAAETQREATT